MNTLDYQNAAAFLQEREGLDPWTALMRVLTERLQAFELPPQIAPYLNVARQHWAGETSDLMSAKLEVWKYIDALAPSGRDAGFPEGRLARALLTVLEPGGDEEYRSMTADWFADMIDS